METTLGKLVAMENDSGYIIYVFQIEDKDEIERLQSKYIMCTQFPNWDHRLLKLGEVGYFSYQIIRAGLDQWFNGNNMVKYRYNMIQFIKFISKPPQKDFMYTL